VREAVSRDLGRAIKIGRGRSDRGGERLQATLLLSAAVKSPELEQTRARWFRGRRDWAERERMPRRTQWWGKGHESEDGEGRTAGRRPRAGQRNSSEGFRP
jgi:hypothetical protein